MPVPRIHLPGPLRAGRIDLPSAQGRRLIGARRLREGSDFIAFSGDGSEWSARVVSAARTSSSAELLEEIRRESPPQLSIELLCGLVRPSRFEWAIEKCVEAGADVIRPLVATNSARGDAPSDERLERWERIAVEAAEQSGRLFVPVIGRPASFETVVGGRSATLVVCDPTGLGWHAATGALPATGTVAVVVGPEGGLTAEELARARAGGALIASLGPHIMRTETAALAATVLIRASHGTAG